MVESGGDELLQSCLWHDSSLGEGARLTTKIGETNSFSHAFGMTAPSKRELRLSTGSLSSRNVFQEPRVLGGVWGRAPRKVFL